MSTNLNVVGRPPELPTTTFSIVRLTTPLSPPAAPPSGLDVPVSEVLSVPSSVGKASRVKLEQITRSLPVQARSEAGAMLSMLLNQKYQLEDRCASQNQCLWSVQREKGRLARNFDVKDRQLQAATGSAKNLAQKLAAVEADNEYATRRLGRQGIELDKMRSRSETLLKVVAALAAGAESESTRPGSGRRRRRRADGEESSPSRTRGTGGVRAGHSEDPQPHHTLHSALVLMSKQNERLTAHLHAVEVQAAAVRKKMKQGLKREQELGIQLDELKALLPPSAFSLSSEQSDVAQPKHQELLRAPSLMLDSEAESELQTLIDTGAVSPDKLLVHFGSLTSLLVNLSACGSVPELMKQVLSRRVRALFDCEHVAFFYRVPSTAKAKRQSLARSNSDGTTTVTAAYKCTEMCVLQSNNPDIIMIPNTGKGIVEVAVTSGKPLLVHKVPAHSAFERSVDAVTTATPRTALYTPCYIQERCVGVLQLINKLTASGEKGRGEEDDRLIFDRKDALLSSILMAQLGQSLGAAQNHLHISTRTLSIDRILTSAGKLTEAIGSVMGDDPLKPTDVDQVRVIAKVEELARDALRANVKVFAVDGEKMWCLSPGPTSQAAPERAIITSKSSICVATRVAGAARFCPQPEEDPNFNAEVDLETNNSSLASVPLLTLDGDVFAVLQVGELSGTFHPMGRIPLLKNQQPLALECASAFAAAVAPALLSILQRAKGGMAVVPKDLVQLRIDYDALVVKHRQEAVLAESLAKDLRAAQKRAAELQKEVLHAQDLTAKAQELSAALMANAEGRIQILESRLAAALESNGSISPNSSRNPKKNIYGGVGDGISPRLTQHQQRSSTSQDLNRVARYESLCAVENANGFKLQNVGPDSEVEGEKLSQSVEGVEERLAQAESALLIANAARDAALREAEEARKEASVAKDQLLAHTLSMTSITSGVQSDTSSSEVPLQEEQVQPIVIGKVRALVAALQSSGTLVTLDKNGDVWLQQSTEDASNPGAYISYYQNLSTGDASWEKPVSDMQGETYDASVHRHSLDKLMSSQESAHLAELPAEEPLAFQSEEVPFHSEEVLEESAADDVDVEDENSYTMEV